jgi:hypothetical protein
VCSILAFGRSRRRKSPADFRKSASCRTQQAETGSITLFRSRVVPLSGRPGWSALAFPLGGAALSNTGYRAVSEAPLVSRKNAKAIRSNRDSVGTDGPEHLALLFPTEFTDLEQPCGCKPGRRVAAQDGCGDIRRQERSTHASTDDVRMKPAQDYVSARALALTFVLGPQ